MWLKYICIVSTLLYSLHNTNIYFLSFGLPIKINGQHTIALITVSKTKHLRETVIVCHFQLRPDIKNIKIFLTLFYYWKSFKQYKLNLTLKQNKNKIYTDSIQVLNCFQRALLKLAINACS